MEFSDILYIGLVSGIISSGLTLFFIVRMIDAFVERTRGRLSDLFNDDKDIVDCYITFADKTMYMYTKEGDEFIAQGTTWEELNENSSARYKDVMFNVKTEQINKAKEFNK